jgi:hypothetical protein
MRPSAIVSEFHDDAGKPLGKTASPALACPSDARPIRSRRRVGSTLDQNRG